MIFSLIAASALVATINHPTTNDAQIFAPGVISSGANDQALSVSANGTEIFFERSNGKTEAIMTSRLTKSGWTAPKVAPFSGKWSDLESALSGDGSYLVFSSNRPAIVGGPPIDGKYYGKVQKANGGQLWRVDRIRGNWGQPYRLPNAVNISSSIYEPSLSERGDVYFQSADPDGKQFHLYVARVSDRLFSKAELLDLHGPAGSSDMDPSIAPDGSFLVFTSDRDGPDHHIYIAFRQPDGWSEPQRLGTNVNQGSVGDPRIDLKHHRLYFVSRRLSPSTGSAQADLDVAARWNNGLPNIWWIPFNPELWRKWAGA